MKLEVYGKVIYAQVDAIRFVSILEEYLWKEREDKTVVTYHVVCDTDHSRWDSAIFRTECKEEAEKVRDMIGEALEAKKPADTYLEGFKAGTEYALKLIERKKNV